MAMYKLLLPALKAFPDLTHLAFTGVNFFFGQVYQAYEIPAPHLHTFPSVTSLDLGPIGLKDADLFQINILSPCLPTFTVSDIDGDYPRPVATELLN